MASNRIISRVAFAAALALLAGCSVGEPYQRPQVQVPARWIDTAGAQSASVKNWWRGFNSPTLNQLIEAADKDNLDLAAAVARVRQADAQSRVAGAPLLPTLDAGANVSRAKSPVLRPTALSSTGTYSTTYSASLTASYEIDFWGTNSAALASAQATAQASRYDLEVVRLTTLSSVANTYFSTLR